MGVEIVEETAVIEIDGDVSGGGDGEVRVEDRSEGCRNMRQRQLLEASKSCPVAAVNGGLVEHGSVVPRVHERRPVQAVEDDPWADDGLVVHGGVQTGGARQRRRSLRRCGLLDEPASPVHLDAVGDAARVPPVEDFEGVVGIELQHSGSVAVATWIPSDLVSLGSTGPGS